MSEMAVKNVPESAPMVKVARADLSNPTHAQALIQLLDSYAFDPMGGGKGLSDFTKDNLAPTLKNRAGTHVILAFVDAEPAGLIICLEGFSTFACKPLMNIHDVVVAPELRRLGLSQAMLKKAEEIAKEIGCCKLTLEVLEGNAAAKSAYARFGFKGYELDPKMGKALFWEKKL
jgi:ribosomal protein S18 acetylase RimI-like enzyme